MDLTELDYLERAEALRGKLYGIALLTLGGEAAAIDAVDEAVYKGYRNYRKLRQPQYFETWLIRILINVCRDELRRRKRELAVETLPETLVLELSLHRFTETGDSAALDGAARFSIHLDPEKTAKAVVVPVEQWVDLEGQRLLVDRLELTPTRTLLYLDGDLSNTAWLQSLDFWFTAPNGTVYDQQDGTVTAIGDPEQPGFYTYYFQSLYFVDHPEQLTLHIAEAVWLDKSEPTVTIDLTSGDWTGTLPEGALDIEVQQVDYDGETATELTVATTVNRMPLDYVFTAPDGSVYDCRGYSCLMADGPEHPARCCYYLTGYSWDTLTASLSYTDIVTPPEPLTIPLS